MNSSHPASGAPISQAFVEARLFGRALREYPGRLPITAADAYAIQDDAIRRWPEAIAGWKVGLVAPAAREAFGAERLVGPSFTSLLRPAGNATLRCPIFVDGFAAVEAEFLVRVGKDVPSEPTIWTADQAREYVGAIHVGVEIASSPFPGINDLGPGVTASDFGNHFGLLVGAEITDWQQRDWAALKCDVAVGGQIVGTGSAAAVLGTPMSAFAFAMSVCGQRGLPLKAGQVICTGASTGVHPVTVGDQARVRFHGIDEIVCEFVAAGVYPAEAQP